MIDGQPLLMIRREIGAANAQRELPQRNSELWNSDNG